MFVSDYIPDDVVDDHFNFLVFIIYFILICNFLLYTLFKSQIHKLNSYNYGEKQRYA